MRSLYTEQNYENAVLELLQNMGYEHVYGPSTERDLRSPLYEDVLEASIRRINRNAPEEAVQNALFKIKHLDENGLLRQNMLFTDYLQNGISADYTENGERRSVMIYLADYDNPENNSFIAANQWTFIENSEKRPDVLLFLNGMPVVLFELKSPAREETDVSDAYRQIRNYMHEIPSMFAYNQICVISDLITTKAGTVTSGEDRFMEWKTKDGTTENNKYAQFDTLIEGMFRKERLLDIIKNFICFDKSERGASKILAAYHQYYAVKKAIESTKNATETDGRGGVFWHTQGSGKSLSMVFYAHLLQKALDTPTIVVITDRNDLDDQLYGQFVRCRDFLRQTPVQATCRKLGANSSAGGIGLKNWLDGRKVSGIIFTTMQKFEESDEPLSERRNIVVMADEAHRGQYGLQERVVDKETGKVRAGAARAVRDCLPNATYIGFTGTPIALKDRNTREVFGDYIDVYDMTQAVADHATRPIYYENRVIKLKLDKGTLELIDREYDLMAQKADAEVIEKSKKRLGQMESVLGNDNTINSLVGDILDHYENYRAGLLTGKAMIVAYSRPIAMKIYRKILELRPAWGVKGKEKVAVVMTSGNNDPEDWRDIIGNKAYRKELENRFKDNSDTLKIAIVVDMWLTGFDVPSLATMYIYKPMAGYNLMQAIARVNRVFGDKEGGLIVDYVGIASALKQAMRDYTRRDRENYGDTDIVKTAYKKFREKLEVCGNLLHGCDYSSFAEGSDLDRSKCLSIAMNFLTAPASSKTAKIFLKEAYLLRQALSLCSSVAERTERMNAAFFEALRTALERLTDIGPGRKFSLKEINSQINELLKESVKSSGVINLFSGVKEKISLMSPEFLNEISKMKEKNLAVEILRRLLEEQVREYKPINFVKSKKFSEMMQTALNKYVNGLISNAEVMEELLKIAKEIAEAQKEGEKLGLSEEETAFYDALTKPQAVKDFYKNDQLIAITLELTDMLRKNKTVDWQLREPARAKMRMMVKKLLKKYKYPPEGQEEAVDTVITQCELWTDHVADFSAA